MNSRVIGLFGSSGGGFDFWVKGQNYRREGGKLSISTEKCSKDIEQCIHVCISSLIVQF